MRIGHTAAAPDVGKATSGAAAILFGRILSRIFCRNLLHRSTSKIWGVGAAWKPEDTDVNKLFARLEYFF